MTTTTEPPRKAEAPAPRAVTSAGDKIFAGLTLAASCVILAALAGVFIFLLLKGAPGFTRDAEVYGPRAESFLDYVLPLLGGTVIAAIIALLIAVPLAWGIALIISHYAPRWIAVPVAYLVDLLAAVPSVVFGLWGVIVLAPKMVPIFDFLNGNLGFIPFFDGNVSNSGRTIVTAGVVLAIMILPIITAITREVFARTPRLNQEAALALGATRWEMMRLAVFPYGRSGMVSASMLGLGRALGETMAVAMVLSLGPWTDFKLLEPGNSSIAANIASKYKERSEDLLAVLIATGLVLFLLTFLVNFSARWVVGRSERRMAQATSGASSSVDEVAPAAAPKPALDKADGPSVPTGRAAVPLTNAQLPRFAPLLMAVVAVAVAAFGLLIGWPVSGSVIVGGLVYLLALPAWAFAIEGRRAATDRLMTGLIWATFVIAMVPLISLVWTVVRKGAPVINNEFLTYSLYKTEVGQPDGIYHAIMGTLIITIGAAIISIPVGVLSAIYLVEYGKKNTLARVVTFLVDVMTGIPSIVAGLFAFALFTLIFGPGFQGGIGGSVALSLLMIPIVVRATEEMLRLVPDDLREASYALGTPKWRTIMKVVLPTTIGGIITGVTLAIARVIGETAPLLLIAGLAAKTNTDPFSGAMTTLPVQIYSFNSRQETLELAWGAALVLIVIVLTLNLVARVIGKFYAPKTGN